MAKSQDTRLPETGVLKEGFLRPPTFSGEGRDLVAPGSFLNQVWSWAALSGITAEATQMRFLGSFLTGPAKEWWLSIQTPTPVTTWRTLGPLFLERFPPDLDERRRLRLELHTSSATGSLKSYGTEFQNMVNRLPGLDQEELLACFLSGLYPPIRERVVEMKPRDWYEAWRLSGLAENLLLAPRVDAAWQPESLNAWKALMDPRAIMTATSLTRTTESSRTSSGDTAEKRARAAELQGLLNAPVQKPKQSNEKRSRTEIAEAKSRKPQPIVHYLPDGQCQSL